MDSRERMSLSPAERVEQERRLTEIFKGVEIDEMLLDVVRITSDWYVYSVEGDSNNPGKKEYRIRNGDVVFNFSTTEDTTQLTWQASVPHYLRPGPLIDDFNVFTNFVFDKLPAKINGFEDEGGHARDYQDNSDVTIALKGIEGFPRKYKMVTADDYYELLEAFTTRPEHIRFISVSGDPGYEDDVGKFGLKLTFPDTSAAYANISLSLPLSLNGIAGWNNEVLAFVLATHKFGPRLKDKKEAAKKLQSEIILRAEEAVI